jgi:hypothetical protein
MRTLFVLLLLITVASPTWAQTPNRTPEKIEQDRKEMERFRKLYPEQFRFNRAPFILEDSSTLILGYGGDCLWLQNNYLIDSIHNNFHNEMPDTSTVTPYSAISVGGPRITLSFAHGLVGMATGTGKIVPTDSATFTRDTAALYRKWRAGQLKGISTFMVARPDTADPIYVRLSLNGRPIFDWKKLDDLPATFCKGSETYVLRGYNYPPMTSMNFGKSYFICDTNLNVNDQLLVEIKESKKNWMLGRFNFTRVAASPQPTALRITGEDGRSAFVPPLEKKTLSSGQEPRIAR